MNKKLLVVLGIVVAIIVIITVSTNSKPADSDVIKIGVILPITGEYGYLGENVVNGIKLAEQQLELETGYTIEIIVEDDVLDSAKGLSAYQKLVTIDNIDALIMGSAPTFDVIYDDAKERGLPVIAINTETRDESDDNVFAVRPAANEVSRGLGAHLKQNASGKVVTVRSNDSLIIKLGTIFDESFGTAPTNFYLNRDTTEHATIATKILAEKPDLVVVSAYATDGALLIKELVRQSQGATPRIAFDSIFNENIAEYQNILGDLSVLDGSIVTSLKTEMSTEFITAYIAMYGTEPGNLSDLGYDSLVVLIESYDRSSSDWIQNISSTDNVAGASGNISFDDIGLRKAEFRIETMKDGVIPKF
jgi:branched-chain amino acid transport system substrate-binding protein